MAEQSGSHGGFRQRTEMASLICNRVPWLGGNAPGRGGAWRLLGQKMDAGVQTTTHGGKEKPAVSGNAVKVEPTGSTDG